MERQAYSAVKRNCVGERELENGVTGTVKALIFNYLRIYVQGSVRPDIVQQPRLHHYGVTWCMNTGGIDMRALDERERGDAATPRTTRASVSFPTDVYQELERIAEAKKVSLAWVVREAAEKYVADQWPLFSGGQAKERQ
jgi:hypothetical protein